MGRGSGHGVRPGLLLCENAATPNTDHKSLKCPTGRLCRACLPRHSGRHHDLALQLDCGSLTALLGRVQVAVGTCGGAPGQNPDPSELLQDKPQRQGQVASSTVWAARRLTGKGVWKGPGPGLAAGEKCPLPPWGIQIQFQHPLTTPLSNGHHHHPPMVIVGLDERTWSSAEPGACPVPPMCPLVSR